MPTSVKVQQDAFSFQIGLMVCNYVPSTIISLFLGSWSDKVGRKPILLMSVSGAFIEACLVLAVMYFNLPLYFILIGAILNGFSGFFTGLLIGSLAYVADITAKEKRSVRLGVMEGVVFISGIFSSFPSGYLLNGLGFVKAYIISWSCLLGSLLYIIFVLRESLSKEERSRLSRNSERRGCFSHLRNLYNVLRRNGPNQWKVRVALPAVVFCSTMTQGIGQIITLYVLNKPLCFDAKQVGYYSGMRFLLTGVGAAIGLRLLMKCLPEHVVVFFGFFSNIASMCLIAFSTTPWMVYLGCALSLFIGVSTPIFRGIISRNTLEGDQGAMFSFSASMELLFTLIGGVLFASSYKASLKTLNFPGLPFLLNAGISIFPFGLSIYYAWRLNPSEESYEKVDDCMENPCECGDEYETATALKS